MPAEITVWGESLLKQTRAVLAAIEAGEADVSLEELTQLQKTERALSQLLEGADDSQPESE